MPTTVKLADVRPSLGQPALRAFHAAGITTLAQLARYSAADLLAMHGVGPKAIRILEAELAAAGRAFRA